MTVLLNNKILLSSIKKETLAQMFSCKFLCKPFFYRTPLVAASDKTLRFLQKLPKINFIKLYFMVGVRIFF